MKKLVLLLGLLVSGMLLMSGVALATAGTGPADALLPIGQAQTVPAHSSQWYRFDVSGGNRSPILATIDDNGAAGIRLAIYTPQQITAWEQGNALTPIGVGASGDPSGHDLLWQGTFNQAATYYAVVYNDSDVNVAVSVRVTGDNVTTSINVQPSPTPMSNPFATPVPVGGGVQGRLAFVQAAGGNIYTVNGDGTSLQPVSFGLDPQWSHAGTRIAFVREGPVPGVYTIDADGSKEMLLYGTNQVRSPVWSPDDSQLLFSYQGPTKGGGQQCFSFGGNQRCFTMPVDVQWKLATISSSGGGYLDVQATNHAFQPTWNPDGMTIAYNDPSIGLIQASLDNSYQPFSIVGDLRVTAASYSPLKLMSPQYSPDGKSIVYMVFQAPAWQIAVANADGSNQRLLTQINPLDFVHPNSVAPVWSPDGKQIMFLSDRSGKWEFFVINADGTGLQQVLKNISDQISLNYDFQGERMLSWTR